MPTKHPVTLAREARGWDLAELSLRAGVSTATIQAWENGDQPHPQPIRAIADVLGLDPIELHRRAMEWRDTYWRDVLDQT